MMYFTISLFYSIFIIKLDERSVYVFNTFCFCVLETFQCKILSQSLRHLEVGVKFKCFEMRKVLHLALLGKNHCDICFHIM